jgi:hypothetical protein
VRFRDRAAGARQDPFPFETARCVSGIGYCAVYTPAGHAVRVVFYADRVTCQTL